LNIQLHCLFSILYIKRSASTFEVSFHMWKWRSFRTTFGQKFIHGGNNTQYSRRKGLANNLARSCPAGMPRFLNSANFLFQIFNVIGPLLLQFSKCLCSTVYLLAVISRTRTLIGWTDVLSLINTYGSIPTVKTLPGIVICQTLPARFSFPRFCNWGRGSARARWRVWEEDYVKLTITSKWPCRQILPHCISNWTYLQTKLKLNKIAVLP